MNISKNKIELNIYRAILTISKNEIELTIVEKY